jgi:hypothetical protein
MTTHHTWHRLDDCAQIRIGMADGDLIYVEASDDEGRLSLTATAPQIAIGGRTVDSALLMRFAEAFGDPHEGYEKERATVRVIPLVTPAVGERP